MRRLISSFKGPHGKVCILGAAFLCPWQYHVSAEKWSVNFKILALYDDVDEVAYGVVRVGPV